MSYDHLHNLTEAIRADHEAVRESRRTTLDRAINAGRNLIAAKRQLSHGDFIKYVRANLPFSQRTANQYMTLARNEVFITGKLAAAANLMLGDTPLAQVVGQGKAFRQMASQLTAELSRVLVRLDKLGNRLSPAEVFASGFTVDRGLIARVEQFARELLAYEERDAYLDVSIDEPEGEAEADATEDRNDLLGPLFRSFLELKEREDREYPDTQLSEDAHGKTHADPGGAPAGEEIEPEAEAEPQGWEEEASAPLDGGEEDDRPPFGDLRDGDADQNQQ